MSEPVDHDFVQQHRDSDQIADKQLNTNQRNSITEILLLSEKLSLRDVDSARDCAAHQRCEMAKKLTNLREAANTFDLEAISLLNELVRLPKRKRLPAQSALLQHYGVEHCKPNSKQLADALSAFVKKQSYRTERFVAALEETINNAHQDTEWLPKVRQVAIEVFPESQTSPRVSFSKLSASPRRDDRKLEKSQSTPSIPSNFLSRSPWRKARDTPH